MLTECPHCFTLVLPKGDGQCPACQRNARQASGPDPELVTLSIGEQSEIPDLCCHCGLPTRRMKRVKRWKPAENAQQTAGFWILVTFLFGGLGSALAALQRATGGRYSGHSVVVRIGQCPECAAVGPPEPLQVDHEHFTMRFLVHRDFARQFERLNGSSAGTPD